MSHLKKSKTATEAIESFNDQLWYYIFALSEFHKQIEKFSPKVNELYTVDLFNNNDYSSKIHVKIGELSSFDEQNKKSTYIAYFSMAYEIFSQFLDDLFDLCVSVNSLSISNVGQRLGPEERLDELLKANRLTQLSPELIKTSTYLRLRRNHFVHIASIPDRKFQTLIDSDGATLNAYWRSKPTLTTVDFTNISISELSQIEVIELIKLLRICIDRYDFHVVQVLDEQSIVKSEIAIQIDGKIRFNQISLQQLLKRVQANCLAEYGKNISESVIQPLLPGI